MQCAIKECNQDSNEVWGLGKGFPEGVILKSSEEDEELAWQKNGNSLGEVRKPGLCFLPGMVNLLYTFCFSKLCWIFQIL